MAEITGIEITLDKTRHLLFNLNGVIDLSDALGVKDPSEFDKALPTAIASDFRFLRKTLWIGLRHEDADLTEEQTGNIIDVGALGEIYDALSRALVARRQGDQKPAVDSGSPAPPHVTGRRR